MSDSVSPDSLSPDPVRKVFNIAAAVLGLLIILTAAALLDTAEPYIPFAIGGAVAFWLRAEPSRMEWMWWLLSLIAIALVLRYPATPDPILWAAMAAAACGFASLLMFIVRFILNPGQRNQIFMAGILPILLVPAYVYSAQKMLIIAQTLQVTTLDLYLYAFDGSLGFQPSYWVGRLLMDHPWVGIVCRLAYYALPLAMGVAYAGSVDVKRGKPSWRLLILFVFAGLFGWAFYNLFPATGPHFVFPHAYPRLELSYEKLHRLFLEPINVNQDFPRNAMPSLHMTWMYLIWWNFRTRSWVARVGVIAFVLLTALGTLGGGEHYFIDVVVAYPFALMVQSVCADLPMKSRMRWIGTAFGCATTLLWDFALRHDNVFLRSRAIPWAAVIVTLVATELVRRKLFDASGERSTAVPLGESDSGGSGAPYLAPA
jgi:PAP2 superfamily protein